MTSPSSPVGPIPGTPSVTTAVVLAAGGIDPTGGAGLTVDIGFLARLGVRCATLATALTVQDDRSVRRVFPVPVDVLREQLDAIVASLGTELRAIKTGLVATADQARLLADTALQLRIPLVVDPLMRSGTGSPLHTSDSLAVLQPLVAASTLLTPNIDEAEALADARWDGSREGLLELARALATPRRVVAVSSGHADGDQVWLAIAGPQSGRIVDAMRVRRGRTHGTGCALASSAAGYMAGGLPADAAVAAAHRLVAAALATSRGVQGTRLSPEPWEV